MHIWNISNEIPWVITLQKSQKEFILYTVHYSDEKRMKKFLMQFETNL